MTRGYRWARSAQSVQCVVARRLSSTPAAASRKAPLQRLATRRLRRAVRRSQLTRAGSCRARSCSVDGPTMRVSIGPSTAVYARSTSRRMPDQAETIPGRTLTSSVAYAGPRPVIVFTIWFATRNTSSAPITSMPSAHGSESSRMRRWLVPEGTDFAVVRRFMACFSHIRAVAAMPKITEFLPQMALPRWGRLPGSAADDRPMVQRARSAQGQRVELEAVLPLADVADARAGSGEALRVGRGLEDHLDRRRDGHEGPDRRDGRIHRLLGDQPVLDDLLVGLGGLEDDLRAVHTREVAAAAGAIVVGRDDELHRVGHRLAVEREIDDPSCLCIGDSPLRRVARRLGHIDAI